MGSHGGSAEHIYPPPARALLLGVALHPFLRPEARELRRGGAHGVGFARTPPVYLQPGDEVTVEIEGVGRLTNPVIEEAW